MAYSDKVIDHFENPRNVGKLDKEDPNVGTGLVGAPACGDVMQLQLKIDEATGTIEEAKFKTFGCGSAIASSSLVTEWVKGRTVEQAMTIKNMDIAKELSLPPVKIHCSVLAEDAVKAAITDYKFKAAVRADLELELHDVAARGRADETGSHGGIGFVELADVAGVLVVVDDLVAVCHCFRDRKSTRLNSSHQ